VKVNKYGLNVIWSEEDKGYIATCPEFPGLSAFGETFEDVIAEAKLAQELFMETYEQEGLPLPKAQPLSSYSGQFRLRIPRSLHHQLTVIAEQEGVSLNQFILTILAARVGSERIARLERVVERLANRLLQPCAQATSTEMDVSGMYSPWYGGAPVVYVPLAGQHYSTQNVAIGSIGSLGSLGALMAFQEKSKKVA
jgi:predicted RNase H-like HicB family nuclease